MKFINKTLAIWVIMVCAAFSARAQQQIIANVTVIGTPDTNAVRSALVISSAGFGTNTFNATNAVNGVTDFVYSSTSLATTATNLQQAISTNQSSVSLQNINYNWGTSPNSFQLVFQMGVPINVTVTDSSWATVGLATNTVNLVTVITNSGASITAPVTFFKCVAPTNFVTLPSITNLLTSYKPGAMFKVRKIDGLTNLLAVAAGPGTSIIATAYQGQNGITNSFQLIAAGVYGTFGASELFTNAYTARYTWDGTTNYISE
jgi:hypothetical protein